jgi:uncharacterized protein
MRPPPDDFDPQEDRFSYRSHREDRWEPEEELPPLEQCWRCGKMVEADEGYCPVCRARMHANAPPPRRHPRHRKRAVDTHGHPIKAVLWMFAILLGTSVIQGWWLHFGANLERLGPKERQEHILNQIILFELIDSVLLIVALAWARTPPTILASESQKLVTWLLAFPILGLLLGLNLLYHYIMQKILNLPDITDALVFNFKDQWLVLVMVMCVQPAIVEELFFRYLTLGHFRRVMGDGAAIWVSAVMFGLAHIHIPLSIPVLILVGVGLGYIRVYSGSMILPMILHGLHNLVVILLER